MLYKQLLPAEDVIRYSQSVSANLKRDVDAQELRELRLEAAGARRREASLKDAHAARVAQLEREIQKLKPAALHAKDLEARLADREQRVQKLRAEVASL